MNCECIKALGVTDRIDRSVMSTATDFEIVREESEGDRIMVWRGQINAGPWIFEPAVVGQACQLCGEKIWRNGFVRRGDDLSPALYRHSVCHSENV